MTATSLEGNAMLGELHLDGRSLKFVDITRIPGAQQLPVSLKILLENVLRHYGDGAAAQAIVAAPHGSRLSGVDIPFHPARVVMQDMAGAPVIHDLVTLRAAVLRAGGDPSRINPGIPAELVVDHSIIVDDFGNSQALGRNGKLEFERNEERFRFLRWAGASIDGLRVVPPGRGIIHQVNIEHLTRGVMCMEVDGGLLAYPDSCVGTDSHTPMVNGLGVLGWGVGGLEATSALLGEALSMRVPAVVGVELAGTLPAGTTATDLVLTITSALRDYGVVGKIVEFHGAGLQGLTVADRASIANMSPEFGSTAAMFPIDAATIEYYRLTGRAEDQLELIEAYARAQGLWADATATAVQYRENLRIDLAKVAASIAGPYRPQDLIGLDQAQARFQRDLAVLLGSGNLGTPPGEGVGTAANAMQHGSLAIAAITSCTNTSNPQVMMTAALVARNAVQRGLRVPAWVKTSLAPGSQVVTKYLEQAGLLPYLEELGFHVVGYGCTTCMGNSGALPEALSTPGTGVVLASVLSGNRNFEGRINPDVRMNYLASPPLVIAYALAGTMDIDLTKAELGRDHNGRPVFLHELWPTPVQVQHELSAAVTRSMYVDSYSDVFTGSPEWQALDVPPGGSYEFTQSTYMCASPFLDDAALDPAPLEDLRRARVLVKLGDSVTTDHISPVGHIRQDSPAGQYLLERGVARRDFNTYGSRRGNHEVMARGTFANVRLRNHLVAGREGGFTRILPAGPETSIFEAAGHYRAAGTPLLVLAGKEYGSGSARDYAAKGTYLLGVKAVLAESYERIHRSNLIGMGIIPLQFQKGDTAHSLGLDGSEEYDVLGLEEFNNGATPPTARIEARRPDGGTVRFNAITRVDTPTEANYIRHGGILPFAFRAALKNP